METYAVDIDPAQVVRWIQEECETAPSTFRALAKRKWEAREIPVSADTRFGDVEREDLTEIATVATLDLAPAHAGDGWQLSIVVEDELAPRFANGDASGEPEQEITLETFYEEFIRPGRATANVVAAFENPAGKAHLANLIEAIETNRHSAGQDTVKP